MKIVRPMTQSDSASSGRASTGGWRADSLRGGRPGGSMRGWGNGGSGVGGRKDVVSSLQQEGEEVSCRNSEVELWAGLDEPNEPRAAHTRYYTDARRGDLLGNQSLQKSGLQTAETSAESPHHWRLTVTPITETVNQWKWLSCRQDNNTV